MDKKTKEFQCKVQIMINGPWTFEGKLRIVIILLHWVC
jgi:hypothetical protein